MHMEKIKVEKGDIFGYMRGVSIKRVILTGTNILNYDLYKMPRKSTDKRDVYKISKNDRGFYILHDKTNGSVDWCQCLC
jgi:hypothetical protein